MPHAGLVVDLAPWPDPAGAASVRALAVAMEQGFARVHVWRLAEGPEGGAGARAAADRDLAGVILSGSAAMVHDEPAWGEALGHAVDDWLARGVPVLATCFAHQFVAHHLGGRIGSFDEPRIGLAPLHDVDRTDPLLGHAASGAPLYWSHRDHVSELPAALVRVAGGVACPVEAYRHRERPLWGVQAHPESSAALAAAIAASDPDEGRRIAARPLAEYDTPLGAQILQRFAALCAQRRAANAPPSA